MTKETVTAALIISFLSVVVTNIFSGNIYIIAILIFIIALAIVGLMERIHNESIKKMNREIEKVENENHQVEQIRSDFVANVSHELKTPLTSIAGFIETLQNGAINDPEARVRFIDIIGIETERLKRLIDDILLLADIESKMDLYEQDIDIKKITDDVKTILEPIASSRNISVHNNVTESTIVRGNADKFKQMLVNLIENAIKYGNDNGNVWIISDDDGVNITLTVKDDGIGIDSEDIGRISERFYRVDKSRSTKAGGTGLGLSIVKHTAALFDGELAIESSPGKGSEFSIIMRKRKQ